MTTPSTEHARSSPKLWATSPTAVHPILSGPASARSCTFVTPPMVMDSALPSTSMLATVLAATNPMTAPLACSAIMTTQETAFPLARTLPAAMINAAAPLLVPLSLGAHCPHLLAAQWMLMLPCTLLAPVKLVKHFTWCRLLSALLPIPPLPHASTRRASTLVLLAGLASTRCSRLRPQPPQLLAEVLVAMVQLQLSPPLSLPRYPLSWLSLPSLLPSSVVCKFTLLVNQ